MFSCTKGILQALFDARERWIGLHGVHVYIFLARSTSRTIEVARNGFIRVRPTPRLSYTQKLRQLQGASLWENGRSVVCIRRVHATFQVQYNACAEAGRGESRCNRQVICLPHVLCREKVCPRHPRNNFTTFDRGGALLAPQSAMATQRNENIPQ